MNNTSHKKVSCALATAIVIGIASIAAPYLTGSIYQNESASTPPPIAHAADASLTLDQKRNQAKQEAIDNFKFATTSLPKWNGTEVACYNSSTKTFTVDTPEKFAYALHYAGTYSESTINITKDIDMGGRTFSNQSSWSNITLNGNDHHIYNFNSIKGLMISTPSLSISNISFHNFKIDAQGQGNISPSIIQQSNTAGSITASNVYAYDSIVLGDVNVSVLFGRGTDASRLYATLCGVEGSIVINNGDHGGGFTSNLPGSYDDCYVDNTTVINYGGHSGGFASCTGARTTFTNCWFNGTVYGNVSTGGFHSGAISGDTVYTNCWTSGVIEGTEQIGGFVSMSGWDSFQSISWDAYKTTFNNCYSTMMVGMNCGGSNLGGFAGCISTGYFYNCYAAGEVGSIDTDLDSATSVGGFVGSIINVDNCKNIREWRDNYCDMQTTAMKNKLIGNRSRYPIAQYDDGFKSDASGIMGYTTNIMTSKTDMFRDNTYTASKGLYPQLASMANHSNPKFRAASAASVSTVFCDTWKELSSSGSAAVFDTVRDIVRPVAFSSRSLFASNDSFSPAYVEDPRITMIEWESDGTVSPIDRTSPVVSLANSSPYYTTALMPGIEWLSVELTYKNDTGAIATGSRRLRLIPTSTIHAGADKRIRITCDPADTTINTTKLYDHNNGFNTTYLDAATLQSYLSGSASHTSALKSFSDIASKTQASNRIEGAANLADHNNIVTSLTLSAALEDAKTGMIIEKDLSSKIQAQEQFTDGDFGLYRIRYRSTLPDGRYLSASKKVAVMGDYSVTYNYNYTGLLQGENISPDSIFSVTSGLKDFEGYDMHNYGDAPQRDGWNFSYWSLDQDGTRPVTQLWFDTYEKRTGNAAENVEFYAQWTKETASVTAVVDPTIGSYLDGEIGEKTIITGAPGSRTLIDVATPPYKHTFSNWGADSLGGGTLEYDADMGLYIFTFGTAPATIPAGYDKITFKITWIDDRTGEVVEEQVVELDDPAVPPAPPHHSGYAFAGYDSDVWQKVTADGTVRILYDWDTIEVPETGSSGMLVFIVGIILACIAAATTTTLVLRKLIFRRAKIHGESDDRDEISNMSKCGTSDS